MEKDDEDECKVRSEGVLGHKEPLRTDSQTVKCVCPLCCLVLVILTQTRLTWDRGSLNRGIAYLCADLWGMSLINDGCGRTHLTVGKANLARRSLYKKAN